MSISLRDVRAASFTHEVKEVEELTLCNKGIVDLGSIADAVNIKSLSLAFNSIMSLGPLTSLQALHTLNVSHNSLVSLKVLSSLVGLRTLNASHNKISNGIGGLGSCPQLQQLYLQNNQLKSVEELRALSSLEHLKQLCLTPNPVCSKVMAPDQSRLIVLALCPQLEMLEAKGVTVEERDSASKIVMADVLSTGPLSLPPPFYPNELSLTLRSAAASSSSAPMPLNRRRGSSPMISRTPSGNLKSQAAADGTSPEWIQGEDAQSVRTAASEGTLASRIAKTGRRGGLKPSSCPISEGSKFMVVLDQLPKFDSGATTRSKRPPMPSRRSVAPSEKPSPPKAGESGPSSSEQCGLTVDKMSKILAHGQGACSEDGAVFNWLRNAVDDDVMSVRSSQSEGLLSTSGSIPRPVVAGRRKDNAAATEGSSILAAVMDTLPKFDPKKLPTTYSPAKVAATTPTKKLYIPTEESQRAVDEIRYTQGSRRCAVTVRHEGSIASYWPNGDLAVTVDVEAAEASAATQRAGGVVAYKMFAMSRQSGNVAVSYDSSGGFIQYANGGIAIMISQSSGSGSVYSPDGAVTQRWSQGASDVPPHVDVMLDQHMGIRYSIAGDTLTLYFSCEGLQCRFCCGKNTGGINFLRGLGSLDSSEQLPDFVGKLTA